MNDVGAIIPAQWRSVGIQLGIHSGQLDGIKEESQGKLMRCFEYIFAKWEDAVTPSYTWSTIVNILLSPSVNKSDLAELLIKKYKLL